jgi:hypothetical protein
MRAFLAAATILLVAGCGSVESLSFRTPPPTPASSTTTAPADLTGARANGVAGAGVTTTGSIPLGPGFATLSGIALGPEGPVGGATVHIDRLVGDAVGSVDVAAQADGTWNLPAILGGRYRVRAWRSPDMDMTAPQIFFLGGTDNRSLTLQLQQFGAANVASAVSPNPPVVGDPANVLVQVTAQTVDTTGVVHATPVVSGSVLLNGGAAVTISNPNPAVTTASGLVIWQVTCQQPGPPSLTVTVNNNPTAYPVDIADCTGAPPPPPPTTAPTTTTSGSSASSSSSTTSTSTIASTTTTARRPGR